MITKIYNNITHGDWVHCNQCGATMLLPCGADQCPECCGCGTLSWVDDNRQECDIDELRSNIEQTNKSLKPEQCLDPETLANELSKNARNLNNDKGDYITKVSDALMQLRSEARIKEGFPEALPFLNFAETTMPAPQFDHLRKLLK